MKKAVFFDIDGTLWDENQWIPDSTKRAIKELQENGHLAFLCSGRTRSFIIEEHLLNLGFDGIVAGCGTYIEYKGEVLFDQELPVEQVKKALAICEEQDLIPVAEGTKALYLDKERYKEDHFVQYLIGLLGDDILPVTNHEEEMKVNKMSITAPGGDGTKGFEAFQEAGYDCIIHSGRLCEIVPAGYNKATGIRKVCEILHLDMENTYAFGDSANDLDMIEAVGCGIAMGNGTPEIKEIADYVTTSLPEDGIYNGLKKMKLI